MPIHKDFHSMLDGMTKQYCTGETEETTKTETAEGYPGKTCRKALSVFYATCKEKDLDYAKPMPNVKEHVAVILPFKVLEKIVDKPLKIRGIAITAGISRNFNIYTPEELQAFAQKLVNSPVYIEHVAVPNAVGTVTKTEWDPETKTLIYEAEIYDDETAAKIRKGLIQHVSVGADYETLDIVDGQVPHGLHNAELSLVAVPGIPETNVQILEKLRNTLRKEQVEPIVAGEYILGFYQDAAAFLPEYFAWTWLDKQNGILALVGRLREQPEVERVHAIFFAKEKMWDQTKIKDWLSIHPDYMAPAGVGGAAPLKERGNMKKKQNVKEQDTQPEPKDDKQRFINHAKIDEETFQKLYAVFGDQLFTLLPARGQKVKEQDGEIKPEEGESHEDFMKRCLAAGKEMEQCAAVWKEAHPEGETQEQITEAEWDPEYVSDLPDECFAYIEPGGEKDEQGKTTPRSLRHFEYKNMQGNLDHDHIVNGLARLGQDLGDWATAEAKATIKKKLCAAVKTWNSEHPDSQITSDVCGVEPSNQEGLEAKVSDLLARVEKIEKAQGQGNLAESLLKKSKEPMIPIRKAINIVERLLPSPMVERSSMGMKQECQDIRRAIFQLKEMLKNG